METITKKLRVINELGLHTRPATMIVKLLSELKSEVTFTCKKETVNARSILNLLMLAAEKNTWITVKVKGIDAKKTMDGLIECFENRFDEDAIYARE